MDVKMNKDLTIGKSQSAKNEKAGKSKKYAKSAFVKPVFLCL